MRPQILFPLFAEIRTLSGVGPKLEKLIAKVAGPLLRDLALNLPVGVVDRSYRPTIAAAESGRIATVEVTVLDHLPPRVKSQPYKVRVSDASSTMELVFFRAKADWLAEILPVGSRRVLSGRIDRFKDKPQMAHPDYIVAPEEASVLPQHEAVYGLTEGLPAKSLAKAVRGAVERVPPLPEWQDTAFLKARKFASFGEALTTAHAPVHEADLSPMTGARQRLAYDELLANQLALVLIRERMRADKGRAIHGSGRLKAKAMAALPFALTEAQLNALAEVETDMKSERRMLRLLQGDVGSGKTVVSLLAMLVAVEAGFQAALMAPTELLVRQHCATLEPFAKAAGVRLAALTGRDKANREQILVDLKDGKIDILIGTHALFSDDVTFRDLGLVVVDEQHRFGVHQRMTLQSKGRTDVLVMTATPIPRTLALTAYGDMEVSKILGRPPGRQKVDTRLMSADRLDELIAHLRLALDRGERAYWVCPLVDESEIIDLAAAEERAVMLRTALKLNVGLSQLHQLRGRVGRGTGKSTCMLVYHGHLGKTAKARLATMRETDDGFVIAEKDLELRGPGEMLGTRQSGEEEFRLASLSAHRDLLAAAHDDARLVLARDPELAGPRGQALRVLLYLFGRDEAVRYLRAG